MAIHPIEFRYGTPEMLSIFQEEARVQKLLDVEAALAWAHAEVGDIPKEDAEKIGQMASTKYVKVERIKAIEKDIKHELTAMETVIEGDLDRLLAVARKMHQAVFDAGAIRVVTNIKIDDRRDKALGISSKIESVKRKL